MLAFFALGFLVWLCLFEKFVHLAFAHHLDGLFDGHKLTLDAQLVVRDLLSILAHYLLRKAPALLLRPVLLNLQVPDLC